MRLRRDRAGYQVAGGPGYRLKQARNLRDLAYARKDIEKAAQEMKMTVSDPVWIDVSEDVPGSGPFPKQVKAKLFNSPRVT